MDKQRERTRLVEVCIAKQLSFEIGEILVSVVVSPSVHSFPTLPTIEVVFRVGFGMSQGELRVSPIYSLRLMMELLRRMGRKLSESYFDVVG